jgi:hypothetical protein
MGRWVMALALMAGCSTPRRAIITGSVMTGGTGLLFGVAAARSDEAKWTAGPLTPLPVLLFLGPAVMTVGAILLVSGIAAAADSK